MKQMPASALSRAVGKKGRRRVSQMFHDSCPQPRAAVGDAPAFLVAGKLAVQDDGFKAKLLPRLPNQRPTGAAGDTFAMTVSLRCAVDLRAGGNHQFAPVVHIL